MPDKGVTTTKRATSSGTTTKRNRRAAATTARRRSGMSKRDLARINRGLRQRLDELTAEHQQAIAESQILRQDRSLDTAGDDEGDNGRKMAEQERDSMLVWSILERREQVERALRRIDEGSYGWCEDCGQAIPSARLEAFPAATLCLSCRQRHERRAA